MHLPNIIILRDFITISMYLLREAYSFNAFPESTSLADCLIHSYSILKPLRSHGEEHRETLEPFSNTIPRSHSISLKYLGGLTRNAI
jgi:hypothetical protein